MGGSSTCPRGQTAYIGSQAIPVTGKPGEKVSYYYTKAECNPFPSSDSNAKGITEIRSAQTWKPNPSLEKDKGGGYDTNALCTDARSCNLGSASVTSPSLTFFQSIPTYNEPAGGSCKPASSNMFNNKSQYMSIGDSKVYVRTEKRNYTGEFGKTETAGPESNARFPDNAPANVKKRNNTLISYHTIDDLYFFCDNVFQDWLYLIQQPDAMQTILNDIRETIIQNPALIMLNKVNNQIGPVAKKLGKTTSFVDIPFGPPLVTIPTSYVLPKKYYHADYKVDNTIDPDNVTYDLGLNSNNIVNSITADDKVSTYRPTNYLDDTFNSLTKLCKIDKKVDKETVICATIPKRGYQLFEVVSDNIDSGSDYRIMQTETLVSITTINKAKEEDSTFDENNKQIAEIQANETLSKSLSEAGNVVLPRIIASFSELGTMLGEAYENVLKDKGNSIGVPVMNIEFNNGIINIDINTLSDSTDNRVYIYVAKASKTLGSYSAGLQMKKDSNGIDTKFISIAYDGQETKETPVMLKKRFTG